MTASLKTDLDGVIKLIPGIITSLRGRADYAKNQQAQNLVGLLNRYNLSLKTLAAQATPSARDLVAAYRDTTSCEVRLTVYQSLGRRRQHHLSLGLLLSKLLLRTPSRHLQVKPFLERLPCPGSGKSTLSPVCHQPGACPRWLLHELR